MGTESHGSYRVEDRRVALDVNHPALFLQYLLYSTTHVLITRIFKDPFADQQDPSADRQNLYADQGVVSLQRRHLPDHFTFTHIIAREKLFWLYPLWRGVDQNVASDSVLLFFMNVQAGIQFI
jgi:hypothetical protein